MKFNLKNQSLLFLLVLTLLFTAERASAQRLELPEASQKATVSQRVGLTDVVVTYHRPAVKGRTVYGELVPYDKVWRTGANEATTISFSDDVMINNQKLAAGRYSLHTIPTKGAWTIIFNKVADQWGSFDYDQTKDALRVTVQPQTGAKQEWLEFSFPEVTAKSAQLVMSWDTVRVGLTIGVEVEQKALTTSRAAVAGAKADDWRTPLQAAAYAFQNNLAMDEAMTWVDKSIAINPAHGNLSLKARMLAKQGKTQEAIKTAEEALAAASKSKQPVDTSATQKLLTELKAKQSAAMKTN